MVKVYRLDIPPCPKPRMTKADRWRKRPSVLKFFAFRDAVKDYIYREEQGCFQHIGTNLMIKKGKTVFIAGAKLEFDTFEIEFHVPMPQSWSKKKKADMNKRPHQQRPDLDNYLKAWKDSVYEEDAVVWRVKASKLWTDGAGHIIVNYL